MATPRKRRLPRGTLDRDTIVAASLRLLDEKGMRGFSMPALGRELGADPSAVYRHFASKDELVLAITDALIAEQDVPSLRGSCWIESLILIARHTWELGGRRPGAMALTASRTAAMPGTFAAADHIIGVFREGGFDADDAGRMYRSFVDFMLATAQQRAALLDLDPEALELDLSNEAAFRSADPRRYPNLGAAAETVATRTWTESFELGLAMLITGIEAMAPKPCRGHTHSVRPLA
ncbi:MAG: TetR/AcrR family transcriptional regulator C-terminal domain-containing protein [Solirubrobacteraceae bacterium]|nr:TetR/AcrR family transcriptional regulator C-terminal domain-containing protein [Solirubrobacteraceae bacterium]